MSDETQGVTQADFAPCPTCKQYSHSISEDQFAHAYNHFQSMIAHPVRGHPMGNAFDERTRDAAQVLMARHRSTQSSSVGADERTEIVTWLREMRDSITPTNEWCSAQRTAFEVAADCIERGDRAPAATPPAQEGEG